MITSYANGTTTGTIGSEIFLASVSSPGSYVLYLDTINMASGDYLEVRAYKMILNSGTARVMTLDTYQGDQPADEEIKYTLDIKNDLSDSQAVRFSIKQTLGTARVYFWTVQKDDSLAPTVTGRTLNVDTSGNVSIQNNIKKNVALDKFAFLMTDSTNHLPATGKTITATRLIDGGAFAAGTLANAAEVSDGIYTVDFGSGDLNGNVIVLRVTASGCDDTFVTFITVP